MPDTSNSSTASAAIDTPAGSGPAAPFVPRAGLGDDSLHASLPPNRDLTEPTQGPKMPSRDYDAVLFVSFGGPEGPDDVLPFLENVLRGKPVPRERMLEVAEHYQHFGGVSPINEQTREFMAAVRDDFDAHGLADLPFYWGNRNWHPMLPETLRKMADDGVTNAIAFVVSAYSSYSGCRQYREDIQRAQAEVGPRAPRVDKIRTFYNHPDFVAANAEHVAASLAKLSDDAHIAFTAHSIPQPMADKCAYRKQLHETCRLVAEAVGVPEERWELVYQSRSGRPQDPWLDPDICDHIEALGKQGVTDLVVAPVGFLSDHMEVMFDLDHEAADAAKEAGIRMERALTAGLHPKMVGLVRKLVQERRGQCEVEAIGRYGANHDMCPLNCCPPPAARPMRPDGGRPGGGRPGSGRQEVTGRPADMRPSARP